MLAPAVSVHSGSFQPRVILCLPRVPCWGEALTQITQSYGSLKKNTYLAPEDIGAGGRKDIVSPGFAQAEALGHVERVVPGAGWADWAASRCVSGEGPPSKVSGC